MALANRKIQTGLEGGLVRSADVRCRLIHEVDALDAEKGRDFCSFRLSFFVILSFARFQKIWHRRSKSTPDDRIRQSCRQAGKQSQAESTADRGFQHSFILAFSPLTSWPIHLNVFSKAK